MSETARTVITSANGKVVTVITFDSGQVAIEDPHGDALIPADCVQAVARALLTPTISEADVEAGAIALFESFAYIEGETGPAWKAIPELGRDRWKREARLVLEAAARQRATGSGVTGG